MHLDKLELIGFKSFPEKTRLKFSPGVSCIVGPNGCGKTNILDAIRWVLGETRMSILRGGKLEEVIFSGTRDIKPLGMAEVNLTIQNDRGVLATPYNQVTVTRRLYRSGDSEFLINKVPCRRKDITEMFYDTGLTSGTYSVIEQDMIDIILSDRAEDRRHFFEEAAGITKYKIRKKEALRKLDNTESDLVRLEDLYSEVSSQTSSLKRQVSKAERHKTLNDEIQKLGVELAIDRWLKIEEKTSQLREQLGQVNGELDQVRSQIKVHELEREEIKLASTEKENDIRTKRQNLSALTDRLHQLEKEISVLQEKSENLKNRHALTIEEIKSLESRRDGLEIEIIGCAESEGKYRIEVNELKESVENGEKKLDDLIHAAQGSSREYEEIQERIKILGRELNQNQESQITLDLKYSGSLEKIEELKTSIESAQAEYEQITAARDELQSRKEKLQTEIDDTIGHRDELSRRHEELKANLQELKSRHENLNSEYHQLNAELEMTGKVIHQYEGYTSGAAQVGKIKDQFPGIIDTVANIINPHEDYTAAVQTVLGELSNYFVVDNSRTARDVLAYARENKLGRFGLIILENIPSPEDPDVTFPHNENIIGQLSQFVKADDRYGELVNYLFKDILISKNIFDEQGLQGFDMVTPEGEMLDFRKTLAIGGTEEIMLVGRKARFDELSQQRKSLESRISETVQEIENNSQLQKEIEDESGRISETLTGLKEQMASVNAELSQAELKLNALEVQLDERRKSRDELEKRISELDSEKSNLSHKLNKRRQNLADAESASKELKQKYDRAVQEKDDYSRELSNLKMKLLGAESSLSTAENNYRRLTELKQDIENSLQEKETLINDFTVTAAEVQRDIKEHEDQLNSAFEVKEKSSQVLIEAEGELAEVQDKINSHDRALKELRNKSEEFSEKSHEINMKSSSLSSQRETLANDTLERYDFDLSSQSRVIRLDDQTRSEREEELEKLRNRLDSLGPVNLLALDEYEQTRSRDEFLKAQIDDLNKAKEDLKTTISRINSTARKKFLETFEVVRKNFQDVFCELFEGGEANLKLEENVDPLEAAIHISARPRGKRLLSIHQLSGGERALTATSLLFSFYMVKPSPFCILDEVDAPLDDANIGRFLKLIKRFTDNTQFIIITHNKLTMEQADMLYGITMSRPGVSQIVSVDLKRAANMESGSDFGEEETEPEAEQTEEQSIETEQKTEAEQEVEVK